MKKIATLFLLLFITVPARADDAAYYAAIGAPICGYGMYRIGDTCYEYGAPNDTLCDTDSVTGSACLYAFVESSGGNPLLYPFSAGIAVFAAPRNSYATAEYEPRVVCGGTGVYGSACLYAFVESSGEYTELSPFAGGFADIGSADIGSADKFIPTPYQACGGVGVYGTACLYAFVESSGTPEERFPFQSGFGDIGSVSDKFTEMKENDCIGTMDGYYVTNITDNTFKPRNNYECTDGYDNYVIANDCQYINMTSTDTTNVHSPRFPDNRLCAVLCDTGKMYTSVEKCATPCAVDGKQHRLYVGDGKYSVPLYMEKLTSPAMHFQFSNQNMCYMNLHPRVLGSSKTKVSVRHNDTTYYSSH